MVVAVGELFDDALELFPRNVRAEVSY